MQKADMPELVKSYFEIPKTGIDLFRLIMHALNLVSIKVRSVKTWSAVRLFSKKPICDLWRIFEDTTCSRSRWSVKTGRFIFPGSWRHRCPGNLLANFVRPIYKMRVVKPPQQKFCYHGNMKSCFSSSLFHAFRADIYDIAFLPVNSPESLDIMTCKRWYYIFVSIWETGSSFNFAVILLTSCKFAHLTSGYFGHLGGR